MMLPAYLPRERIVNLSTCQADSVMKTTLTARASRSLIRGDSAGKTELCSQPVVVVKAAEHEVGHDFDRAAPARRAAEADPVSALREE